MRDLPCNSGPYMGRNTGRTEHAERDILSFAIDPTPHSRLRVKLN